MRAFFQKLLPNLALCLSVAAVPQTLARPGWAGSGMAAEAWWRTAVFYRIDVAHFQDSDGDGVGDVRGVAERLNYLQRLGVDAVVLEGSVDGASFDLFLRAASAQRIRVLVALPVEGSAAVLNDARQWLSHGAAGVALSAALLESHATAARDLHALIKTFAGQRVLLALPEAGSAARGEISASDGADLVGVSTDVPQTMTDAPFPAALRRALVEAETPPIAAAPLLYSDNCCRTADAEFFAGNAARTLAMNKITAARLLGSHGAVVLLYGQELGLLTPQSGAATMRWTPTNVTAPKVAPVTPFAPAAPAPAPPAARQDVYGAFIPYVQQKPAKKAVETAESAEKAALEALRGFSTKLGTDAGSSALNVASEEADSGSLLNFYRRLIQLHHDQPALRGGVPVVLDYDRQQGLVWLRRAPAGARTAGSVVVVCNLGGAPLRLSLRGDFLRLRVHARALRPLLASWTAAPLLQSVDAVDVPAYGVLVAEVAGGG